MESPMESQGKGTTSYGGNGNGRVVTYIVTAAILFGSMEATCKMAASGLDSFQLTAVRFLIGGLVLLPFAFIERRKKAAQEIPAAQSSAVPESPAASETPAAPSRITLKDHLWMLLLGVVCIPVSMVLFQLGVEHSNAATAAVLFCVNPIFTAVLAHFFGGETMTKKMILAFAISLVGILILIRPWDLQPGNTFLGVCCTLLAAVTFSIYTVMGKRSIPRLGNTFQTSLSFLYGTAVLLLLMIPLGRPFLAGLVDHPVLVAYIGVFVTGLGYLSYFKAIEHSNAITGSITFLLKPAIAPIIAVILLAETILWNSLLGIGLILAASVLNLLENRRRQIQGLHRERAR